jgi:NADP-dependent 3-hydroxy acid dehydrogenase YdfG
MSDLKGQVALVTGATRGIGRAIALRLTGEGVKVCIAGRDMARADAVKAEIEAGGGTAMTLSLDVSDPTATQQAVEAAIARFGRLDIAVANAGICTIGTVEESNMADWRAMMDVNFFGAAHLVKAVLPRFLAQNRGDIVAIASTAGITGYPEWAGYCASKWALMGFLECLGREMMGRGIRVSTICPGSIDTPLWDDLNKDVARAGTPARRAMMTAEDVAETVMLQLRLPRTALIKSLVTFPTNEWH